MKTFKTLFLLAMMLTVHAMGYGQTNIAENKTVTASSVENATNKITNVVDGKLNTRWGSASNAQNPYPHWVTIDLDRCYVLDQIKLYWFDGGTSRSYQYEIKDEKSSVIVDGSNNTITGSNSAPSANASINHNLEGVATQLVTVNIVGAKKTSDGSKFDINASLWEVEIYGWSVESSVFDIDLTTFSIKHQASYTREAFLNTLTFYGGTVETDIIVDVTRGELSLGDSENIEDGDILAVTYNGKVTELEIVGKSKQTITFSPIPAKTEVGQVLNLTATASSGLPVSYEVSPANAATIEDGKATINEAGAITIIAKQVGDDVYAAAPDIAQTIESLAIPTLLENWNNCPTGLMKNDFSTADGLFTDARDNKQYAYKRYGNIEIFMQNLNWDGAGSIGDEAQNPDGSIYGRYYQKSDLSQNICPEGWELTSKLDWGDFGQFLKESPEYGYSDIEMDWSGATSNNLYTNKKLPKYIKGGEALWTLGTIDAGANDVQFNILPSGLWVGTDYYQDRGVGITSYFLLRGGDERFYTGYSASSSSSEYYDYLRHTNAATSSTKYGNVRCRRTLVTFPELAEMRVGDADMDPAATTSSQGVITYSSSDVSIATIIDDKIHAVAPGIVDITALLDGTGLVTRKLLITDPTYTLVDDVVTLTGKWSSRNLRTELPFSNKNITAVDATGDVFITESAVEHSNAMANPNCIMYFAEGKMVPNNWKNIVKGTVASKIELVDNDGADYFFKFNNIKSFTATEITYTRNYPTAGLSSICLPFAVSAEEVETLGIIPESFDGNKDVSTLKFKTVSEMDANTPYLIEVTAGTKIFKGNGIIEITANPVVTVEESDYQFGGVLLSQADVAGKYVLDSKGNGFALATDDNFIPSFRAYIENAAGSFAPARLSIEIDGENVTKLDNTTSGVFTICPITGGVEIISGIKQTVQIYGIDGILVATRKISCGTNTINLPGGMYIIANQKVVVK